ncbi:uncharacterized protein LOC129775223 [Toxorhynchites rutilus septentrionalis]|uniref:uncharacterized protein LOC129775223 n=1 Tax=Toxorhynchites rutilus septentrionalis TaxID=329112 RepID=UPI00247AB34E|nr:uncharacterized protein LOC129775223 [Toxorhynchites rutilus septentrionalis]XP_055635629.1 uncharacterized protein LOC129775223 [Toxorhynchites rutilus septentrionalis]XP_055635630.1 uncharacterized protein LOC129775223 [Toxorhynchites rutilus septentrionalis]XP_055635631.1 uncharacterized protein LOC129775223 [Toxorhynchites rutilus septentrionalis]XP_055635633.1 uncharacterized protein LOC129775223 [Toxorhynchites rutilus septentrionalis]
MPRIKPTTKLGVYGQYDLNPQQAVNLYIESKLQNEYYKKKPSWDVARLGLDLMGIQSNREYQQVTKEQSRMRKDCQKKSRINEKRLQEANKLVEMLLNNFVEVNDFLKSCEAKENESYAIMESERNKQINFNKKIEKIEDDLQILRHFIGNFESTVKQFQPFEDVLEETIQSSSVYGSVEELMKRCDSLLLVQVEISEIEQQKIQDIELIRENLLKSTKNALHTITGLNNDLSNLQIRYVHACEECLKWEQSITSTKNYMALNEMKTNCMLDVIFHLYDTICKRRGESPKFSMEHVEQQLDFIKEEVGLMQEVMSVANAKLTQGDMSLLATKSSNKEKYAAYPTQRK